MKTLFDYFQHELARTDPHPAIDHALRAQLHEDGRISFYIHADGRDSTTMDFWVAKDGTLKRKRLCDEPLNGVTRLRILEAVSGGRRWLDGEGSALERLAVRTNHDVGEIERITKEIETVEGISANYSASAGDELIFYPRFGGNPLES